MILWGWNTIVLKQVEPHDLPCPICLRKGYIVILLMCKVFHLFFIPICPDTKYIYAVCKHCGEEISEIDVEKEHRKLFRAKSYHKHIPLKAWTGLFLILLISIIYFFLK